MKKACGFISGVSEIKNWSGSDLFQFLYDTVPLYGDLHDFIPKLKEMDVKEAVKKGAENLYHSACHAYLYDADIKESLVQLYKMVFFILQAEYFLESKEYIVTKQDLIHKLDGVNKTMLENCINRNGFYDLSDDRIDELYNTLIEWCSKRI